MICQKCGALLNENAKFCTACGSSILADNTNNPDLDTAAPEPQAVNSEYKQPYQQFYENSQNDYKPNTINNLFKSSTTYKVIAGVAFILLLWIMVENDSLKRQINDYDNRGTIEKSADAIGSWWDTIFE